VTGIGRAALAAAAALVLAACDQQAQHAVQQAGSELKREAKETGAQAKDALREVGETTGQVLEDTAITAKVKAALHAEKDVKSRDIEVETFQGKVVIKGVVPDRAQAERAAKVAASVAGVKAVENRLSVN
jgi:hyperosmotically inducible periplasmic protein